MIDDSPHNAGLGFRVCGKMLVRTRCARKKANLLSLLVPTLWLVLSVAAEAQQAIFLVRHGETVAPMGTDLRPLSEAGHRRAALLATLLKEAGISTIFTSDLERTVKTAEPLAQSLRIEPQALEQLNTRFKQSDLEALVARLRRVHSQDNVLVVGHSNSVPALLKALGHPVEIKISEADFGNLFVLMPKSEGPPTLLRLRY